MERIRAGRRTAKRNPPAPDEDPATAAAITLRAGLQITPAAQQFGRLSVDEAVAPVDALPVVLPDVPPPLDPLAAGGLEGELEGEAGEAAPALDGLAAVFSRGWPFESLQCVEAEMLLLLAPAAGGEEDCA